MTAKAYIGEPKVTLHTDKWSNKMPADDFNTNTPTQNDGQSNDPTQGQGQGQGQGQTAVSEVGAEPWDTNNDTGTQAATGEEPSGVALDDARLETQEDSLPVDGQNNVEDIESDPAIEPAGADDTENLAIKRDQEAETQDGDDSESQ